MALASAACSNATAELGRLIKLLLGHRAAVTMMPAELVPSLALMVLVCLVVSSALWLQDALLPSLCAAGMALVSPTPALVLVTLVAPLQLSVVKMVLAVVFLCLLMAAISPHLSSAMVALSHALLTPQLAHQPLHHLLPVVSCHGKLKLS